jgi:signal transduction histidine kinase
MHPAPPASILIVDDELAHQRILAGILAGAGYHVHTAGRGADTPALAHALSPDLIILDVALTDGDGYGVCRTLKANSALAAIPVIFLSAANDSASKTAAFAAGAVDYVGKPFDAPEVLARARAQIELYRLQSGLESKVAARTADLEAQAAANETLLAELRHERESLAARVAARTEELRTANERLGDAMRAKDAFLAAMSHELRTPLNAILGLAEMLDEGLYGELEPRQRRAVCTIGSSGRHLLSLINDILDLAKIEAGREELELELTPPAASCRIALDLVAETARTRGIALSARLDEDAPPLRADRRRLHQILVNLLANAIKFTPEGGAVWLEHRRQADGTTRLTVGDTGVGIAPGNQQRLFRAFSQVDSARDRGLGGTGLGLALVARLARLHGGSVALCSAPGEGSRFSVVLPVAEERPEAPEPSAEAPALLVLDDYEPSGRLLSAAARATGHRCAVTRGTAEVVGLLKELQPRALVAVLPIADHQGEALLPVLRSNVPAAIPILAVGSVTLRDSATRARAAGAAAYLALPADPAALAAALREVAPASAEKG